MSFDTPVYGRSGVGDAMGCATGAPFASRGGVMDLSGGPGRRESDDGLRGIGDTRVTGDDGTGVLGLPNSTDVDDCRPCPGANGAVALVGVRRAPVVDVLTPPMSVVIGLRLMPAMLPVVTGLTPVLPVVTGFTPAVPVVVVRSAVPVRIFRTPAPAPGAVPVVVVFAPVKLVVGRGVEDPLGFGV